MSVSVVNTTNKADVDATTQTVVSGHSPGEFNLISVADSSVPQVVRQSSFILASLELDFESSSEV